MAVTPSPGALITLDEYKLLVSDPATPPQLQGTDLDDYRQQIINNASAVIRAYCRLPLIYEQIAEEEHDGTGRSSSVWLRQFPVVTATVTEDGTELTAGTDYKLRKPNGELIRMCGSERRNWPRGVMNIVATYTAGRWETVDDVPGDVKQWAAQACDWLQGLGAAAWGAQAVQMGIIKPDAIPAPIKRGLAPYMRGPGV